MSRTRRTGIVAAALLALGALGAPAGTATASVAPNTAGVHGQSTANPADIKTPFELSGGATWTTLAQWTTFWQSLDAASTRVTVSRAGTTVQNRAINLVAVGAPPKPVSTASAGQVLLVNCSIHGMEPAGREACMILARDMATTTDTNMLTFLSQYTVLFVDVNLDGWVANTRWNAAGVDVNRDFLKLSSPEARVLVEVINTWKPDALNGLFLPEVGVSEAAADEQHA